MAAEMTFGDLQTRVRRKLNETSTVFWTDQDVKDAINEGYAEMADGTEFYERQAQVPMIEGHMYYDLSLGLPDTFLSPRRAQNVTTSQWLEPTDPLEMDYHTFPQWELTAGQPEKHFLRGNWWLGVWPKPSGDQIGQRFYYTSIPAPMEDDDDVPAFPVEFHDALIEYAMYDLLAQKREAKKALLHWDAYLAYEMGLRSFVNDRIKRAAVRVL